MLDRSYYTPSPSFGDCGKPCMYGGNPPTCAYRAKAFTPLPYIHPEPKGRYLYQDGKPGSNPSLLDKTWVGCMYGRGKSFFLSLNMEAAMRVRVGPYMRVFLASLYVTACFVGVVYLISWANTQWTSKVRLLYSPLGSLITPILTYG